MTTPSYDAPRFCQVLGVWYCVTWPWCGRGSTPHAAWVDMELRRFYRARGC